MNTGEEFYRAFEETYRGTRSLIKQRLGVYKEFVMPVIAAYPGVPSVDLGCGRGEWLELIKEWGCDALGIDLDEGMLVGCKDLGLATVLGDAIAYVKSLENESHSVLTGFHFVEHLEIEQLMELVGESMRVLKAGGLLILETPNPDNLQVATMNFYLDPSHNRPIPFQLLGFIAEYYGFERVKVLFLQEDKNLLLKKYTDLGDVVYGVSPDYAIVAQKSGHDALWNALEMPFLDSYGISKQTVVARFNDSTLRIAEHVDETVTQLGLIESRIGLGEKKIAKIENEILEVHREIDGIGTKLAGAHQEIQGIRKDLVELNQEISSMVNLLSPLLKLISFFKKV